VAWDDPLQERDGAPRREADAAIAALNKAYPQIHLDRSVVAH
jgi:hypothetical protein